MSLPLPNRTFQKDGYFFTSTMCFLLELGPGMVTWLVVQMGADIVLVCRPVGHGKAIKKCLRICTF